eukprot:scaffold56352_cov48-Cyclotella_meneghiniana.AAC.1
MRPWWFYSLSPFILRSPYHSSTAPADNEPAERCQLRTSDDDAGQRSTFTVYRVPCTVIWRLWFLCIRGEHALIASLALVLDLDHCI